MKKKGNKFLKASVPLLMLTLVTSCFVGGTFAKYVTTADATETARVAKWGITAEVKGNLFKLRYNSDTDGYSGDTVETSDSSMVVAPGTDGEFGGITLSGTPEVAVKINTESHFGLGGDWVDKDGNDYCPIDITINGVTKNYTDFNYNVEAFEQWVNENIQKVFSCEADPGDDLSVIFGTKKVSWKWSYEGNDDEKDTYLGDIAAGKIDGKSAPTITFGINTTVTQID